MTLKRSRRWLTGHIAIWGIVALGVIGIFTALQRQMIYYPTVAGERALLDEAARLGLQSWQDENGDLILDDMGNIQFGWVTAPIVAYYTQNVPGAHQT